MEQAATQLDTIDLDEWEAWSPEPIGATETDRRKQGYSELRKRNPTLYKAWRNHIRACFDEWDYGYLHANGKSKPRANLDHKKRINAWMNWMRNRGGNRPMPPKQ